MKLVIFTPVEKKSAIGRMTSLLTRALLKSGVDVLVVRTESQNLITDEIHDFGTDVLNWQNQVLINSYLCDADASVYQIGNFFGFHEGAIHWIKSWPGLICLHDFFLGHLFYGWSESNRDIAKVIINQIYGPGSSDVFFSFPDGSSFIEGTREQMPMTEWICSQANAVITHSKWGCDRVLKSCPGPVSVVPLPYDAPGQLNFVDKPLTSSIVNLVTIGHVNPNKRIDSVLKAIAKNTILKHKIHYTLAGPIDDSMRQSLLQLSSDLGVSLVVRGEVNDSELISIIDQADVISCLRWPTFEAASASAIEGMLYGKLVIVTDTGFYSELDSDSVVKINPLNEIDDLTNVLLHLVSNPDEVLRIGSNAKIWAGKTFSADNYADQLVSSIHRMNECQAVLQGVSVFTKILSQWTSQHISDFHFDFASELSIFQ